MWNELKSEITNKSIVKVFKGLVYTIIIILLTIYFNNINENKGLSELSIKDEQYEVYWRPLIDPNESNLNTNDRYQVIVSINVANNKDSNYQAEITNVEYFLSNSDSQVDYWRASPSQYISIQPGANFSIGASHIVKLDPGNYTLKSEIDYQDKKGIRTPLRLSGKIFLSYNKSKIEPNLSSTPFKNNVNLILNFFIEFSIKVVDFVINFLNKNDIFIGLIIGLIIGSPWILFKVEKFIRNLLSLPILSMELKSRQVFCKDGFVIFHGISLKNKMWFTNKIPVAFCVAPTMLNWGSQCSHIGTIWDDKPNFMTNTINDFKNKYYRCIVEQTQDDLKRKMDIYRGTGKTVYVIMEDVYIEDNSIPLNESNKIGKFYLNSRNLMPDLKIGWSQTLQVISEDFGLIDAIKIKIPDNLREKEPLDKSLLEKIDRDKYLFDVGIPNLRWPLRIEMNRKIS